MAAASAVERSGNPARWAVEPPAGVLWMFSLEMTSMTADRLGQMVSRLLPAYRPRALLLVELGEVHLPVPQGKTFFTMGGASSHDIDGGILEPDDPLFKKKCRRLDTSGALYRVNHLSWWKEELPSEEEYQTARANLDRAGWAVDYIITHCCPSSVQDVFSGGFYRKDALTKFFDEVNQRCQFKYWFFGHYHEDMVVEKISPFSTCSSRSACDKQRAKYKYGIFNTFKAHCY